MNDATNDQPSRCLAAGCKLPQAAGAVICASDIRKLGDWLAQLGTEYELLSADPSMQGREVGSIGGTALASQRSPGITQVMAMRDGRRGTGRIAYDDADPWGLDDTPSVLATLASYAEMVRAPEEDGGRGLAEPVTYVEACRFPCMHRACLLGMGHPVRVPLTVARERRLLAVHLPWIVKQQWAGEFHDDIRRLWTALRSANGHASPAARVRRLQAPCTACGVRAVTHRHGDDLMECQSCHATAPFEADHERMSA